MIFMMTRHDNIGNFGFIWQTIDQLLPEDHRVRLYDSAIDWKFIYPLVENLYSNTGRPSIDPIVLFKMVFLNYIDGIHSMRKTCQRCQTDIAYRWFLRLDFGQPVPNHSTYSKNLQRKFIETDLFKKIFSHIIKQAYDNGFIDVSNIFGDSTHVKANANKNKNHDEIVEKTENAYYEDLLKDINEDRINHGKKALKNKDDDNDKPNMSNTINDDDEQVKSNDQEEIIDEIVENDGSKKIVTYNPETGEINKVDKNTKYKHIKVSNVDPDSGYYHKGEHEKVFAYTASAFCDKNGFIIEAYLSKGNIHDSISFKGLYDNYKENFLFNKTKLVCLDNGYVGPSVAKMVIDSGKEILLPYKRPMTKDGFFRKPEYVYDELYDKYICPNNEWLDYSTTNKNGYREYKSNPNKCIKCPFLNKCTKSTNHTKVVTRHVWEDYVEKAIDTRYKIGYKEIYKKRKETIERCFGDGKENFGLRFTRYKGAKRVLQGILLLFSCMNLKKLALRKKLIVNYGV